MNKQVLIGLGIGVGICLFVGLIFVIMRDNNKNDNATASVSNTENNSDTLKTEAPVKKRVSKEDMQYVLTNWQTLITAELNQDFSIAVTGGIDDATANVTNDTKYKVEYVCIEVNYKNVFGKVVNTKNVEVKDIEPNSKRKIDLPESKRGVDIEIQLINVECKSVGLEWQLYPDGNAMSPQNNY